jgi:membrane protein DedA with SNARE-associated domain
MFELIEAIAGWVTDTVYTFGYLGVAFAVALENVFPPIPSEVVLPLAGFLAGQGRFSLPLVIVAATVGSVIGALALYAFGAWFGERRVRWFVRRFGIWFLVRESDLDQTLDWFRRHGRKSVCIGRVVPLVRSLVSIPAGIAGVPLLPFIVYTTVGSTVWNTLLIGAGWLAGDQWERVEGYTRPLTYAVLVAVGAATIWFVWRRRASVRWRRGRRTLSPAGPSAEQGDGHSDRQLTGSAARPGRRADDGE